MIFDILKPRNQTIMKYYINNWHENWSLCVSIIIIFIFETSNCIKTVIDYLQLVCGIKIPMTQKHRCLSFPVAINGFSVTAEPQKWLKNDSLIWGSRQCTVFFKFCMIRLCVRKLSVISLNRMKSYIIYNMLVKIPYKRTYCIYSDIENQP